MLENKTIIITFIILNIILQYQCISFHNNNIKKVANKILHSRDNLIQISSKLWNNIKSSIRSNDKTPSIIIPPILLFLFSISDVHASPLNKQYININGPFFQGWLIRNIDHSTNTSFILIIGSFSKLDSNIYDEHYVFCGISSLNYNEHIEYFPPIDTVTIKGNKPPLIIPSVNPKLLNITWNANNFGKFVFMEDYCYGSFNFKNKLILTFNTTSRISWLNLNHTCADRNKNIDGPEGWLGYSTLLLPCHYFVHSVGSICDYTIIRKDINDINTSINDINNNLKSNQFLNKLKYRFKQLFSINNRSLSTIDYILSGKGYAHIEGNHGSFFPEGWIWSQCIAKDNVASFSLVIGKFNIAGITPTNTILYIRRSNKKVIIFRTTDMDQVTYKVNSYDGSLSLNATSLLKNIKVEIIINPTIHTNIDHTTISRQSAFGAIVHIPTAEGFSNNPGCRETYNAIANVKIWDLSNVYVGNIGLNNSTDNSSIDYIESEEFIFPFTALEYGGSFINKLQ